MTMNPVKYSDIAPQQAALEIVHIVLDTILQISEIPLEFKNRELLAYEILPLIKGQIHRAEMQAKHKTVVDFGKIPQRDEVGPELPAGGA